MKLYSDYFIRFKPSFIIQWHITERCNWDCKHCYRDEKNIKELSLGQLRKIIPQCIELFKFFRVPRDFAHINICGGEPFVRNDIFDFLNLLKKYKRYYRVHILTNGSFIDDFTAKQLKKAEISGIQVSLEGLEDVNDAIRGKGSYQKVMVTLDILRKNKIFAAVSLTLTKINFPQMEQLAKILYNKKVNRFSIRRFTPLGFGKALKEYMLTPFQMKDYYKRKTALIKKYGNFIHYNCEDAFFTSKIITGDVSNETSCGVIRGNHLNIFTNGDVLACRRFPIKVGSVLDDTLFNIYFNSDVLWELRDIDNLDYPCKKCNNVMKCFGGARCVAYGYFGRRHAPDPQCYHAFRKLPSSIVSKKNK